jgi:hypothetical protein
LAGVQAQGKGSSDHLLSHSNSFGIEMEIGTAGCRAYNRIFIVGGKAQDGPGQAADLGRVESRHPEA